MPGTSPSTLNIPSLYPQNSSGSNGPSLSAGSCMKTAQTIPVVLADSGPPIVASLI